MKKLMLFSFLLLSLALLLNACSQPLRTNGQQFSCPKQYMPLGDECCVDSNSNKICDEDERVVENVEERVLESVARNFARHLEREDSSKLYDILTKKKKDMLDRNEFIRRHSIIFGAYYRGAREAKPKSVSFVEARVNGNDGYVTFFVTGQGQDADIKFSSIYFFKKENDGWKYDGFDEAFYAYCEQDIDCDNNPILQRDCENTCMVEGFPLNQSRYEKSTCKAFVCSCSCIEKFLGGKRTDFYPMWNTLH